MNIVFADDKETPICTPLLKRKAIKAQETGTTPVAPLDLNTIDANLTSGHYESVAQFDSEMNAVFTSITREHGRMSTLGSIAVQLKKIYNTAKSDFAEQLVKISGPDEPLPAGFLQKNKPGMLISIC